MSTLDFRSMFYGHLLLVWSHGCCLGTYLYLFTNGPFDRSITHHRIIRDHFSPYGACSLCFNATLSLDTATIIYNLNFLLMIFSCSSMISELLGSWSGFWKENVRENDSWFLDLSYVWVCCAKYMYEFVYIALGNYLGHSYDALSFDLS